jgi:two-component system, OmpR family, sensor histidine kinase KdpD
LFRRIQRLLFSLGGVALVTFTAHRLIPVNATTVGFAYLLLVLIVASTWGFSEAAVASIAATVTFNFYFLPPVGTLTIADPQNWVALFSFLATALIASQLSDKAERRAQDAIARRQDVEHLYTFSRAILLIDDSDPFPKQLAQKLADIFPVTAAVLYDRRTGEMFRAGPSEFDGLDEQLRDAAWHGSTFSDPERQRVITAVRLGSEPIAALALQGGAQMPDSVLQGIANLVAIGLERARAQDLTHQVEAARRSEQLRTTLLDAMAHEFKTPLTAIKAATTALLASPDQSAGDRAELLTIADEEAEHLKELIDDAIEMARLDNAQIDLNLEKSSVPEIVREAVASMQTEIGDRPVKVACDPEPAEAALDRRLMRLAVRQLLDNALKYSPPQSPITVRVGSHQAGEGQGGHGQVGYGQAAHGQAGHGQAGEGQGGHGQVGYGQAAHGQAGEGQVGHDQVGDGQGSIAIEVANCGAAIPPGEQARIFERFYRGAAVKEQVPGSGLGLSIAARIVQAHHGELTVASGAGQTAFRMTLPQGLEGGPE